MTPSSMLPIELRLTVSCLMFLCGFTQLLLCIYKYKNSQNKLKLIPDALLLSVLTLASAFLTTASKPSFDTKVNISLPVAVIIITEALLFTVSAVRIYYERRLSAQRLSADSIRQALDDLNAGVLFSDPEGKTVLINHTMLKLSGELTGGYPQLLSDLRNALEHPEKHGTVERLDDATAVLRFPDGKVWRFFTVGLESRGLYGYNQTVAQDITEIYYANEKLSEENEALRQTNIKLRQMYLRLADRIRDEETLRLKSRVHDNIGTSLIAITDILNNNGTGDAEAQLKALNDAVSYFSNDVTDESESLEQVVARAAEMKVELRITGELPDDSEGMGIILLAAKESVTNCIHHAGGNLVKIEIRKIDGKYKLSISNNGTAPDAPIKEGGGLSSLRKRVESYGGLMEYAYEPEFQLIITL